MNRGRFTIGGKRRGQKVVSLALQGGGAHGAFTWGVLDRLLNEERISKEALDRRWFTVGQSDRRLKRINLHLIEDDVLMRKLRPSSRLNTRLDFLTMLRDRGRARAKKWLRANFGRLGTKSSVILSELFG